MSKEKEDNREKRVLEIRRTTYLPQVATDRFVFERHDKVWHAHFAAASNYSLDQMKEIVAAMKELPLEPKELNEDE